MRTARVAVVVAAAAAALGPVRAEDPAPVPNARILVELFTSQG